MSPMIRSPVKLAPVFNSAVHNSKRKKESDAENEELHLGNNHEMYPKRKCVVGHEAATNELKNNLLLDPKQINIVSTGESTNDPEHDTHLVPKQTCDIGSADVTNVMILQAITSLSGRFDGMESKLIATVDSKLQTFEMDINAKVVASEERLDTKISVLKDELNCKISNVEDAIDSRISEALFNYQASAEARIDQLERNARSNELVISGVPTLDNEDLYLVCNKICEAIGFNGENIMQSCFRVLTRNRKSTSDKSRQHFAPPIVVKFWNTDAKSDFFKSYIAKKNLCVTSIGFSTPSRIYINENFTKKNYDIYRLARQLKIGGKIFQHRSFNGRVSIKLREDSEQIVIDSREHLNLLMDPTAAQQPNQRIQSQNKNKNQRRNRERNHHRGK